MNRWLAPLLAFLSVACIDVNRPRRTVEDTGVTDTSSEDVDSGTIADTTEVDIGPGECDEQHACLQPSAPCAEAACEGGHCVVRQRRPDAPCDDGNPCTGDGTCQGDACRDGAAKEDGSDCEDGVFCNGFGSCESGECIVTLLTPCPQIAAPCVSRWECSEEARGGCVPVPTDDGDSCDLPDTKGTCSLGACVPEGMVHVAAGVFTLGCDASPLCPTDARPAHDIELSAYAVDRTEVTEATWRACVAEHACSARTNEEELAVKERPKMEPVRDVSWIAARDVCAYQGRRLCTEAEWEKAARGSTGGLNFPWGNTQASCERAVYHELGVGPGCGEGGPSEVGQRALGASPYGALDMAGNVAEWVLDAYDDDIYQSQIAGTPKDPAFNPSTEVGPSRVVRGGGWATLLDGLRVFKRVTQTLTFFDDEVGVRCCWDAFDDAAQPETSP